MKRIIAVILLFSPFVAFAQDQKQDQKPATLRSILLDQLKSTHTEKDWFVTTNVAVEGLTPEQANWTDGKGNHQTHYGGSFRKQVRPARRGRDVTG